MRIQAPYTKPIVLIALKFCTARTQIFSPEFRGFQLLKFSLSCGHVFFLRLSDEKCKKNSVYEKNQSHRCSHIHTGDRSSLKENGRFVVWTPS